MTDIRKKEIITEATKRIKLLLQKYSFDNFTCGGSFLRFNMALSLNGPAFELEKWQNQEDFKKFVTDEEWNSSEYDIIIKELYYSHYGTKKLKAKK
jgi:hypothetical protein